MKKLLLAIFVMCVSAIGCEIPYTGPMLTVDDVDQYLHSIDEDAVCLQDGLDSLSAQEQEDNDSFNNSNDDNDDIAQPAAQQEAEWTVWINYQDGKAPEGSGTNFNVDTGFQVAILVEGEDDVTYDLTSSVTNTVQTKDGPGGDALQFFVPTKLNEIVIEVNGLFPNHRATFTMAGSQDGVTRLTSALQLSPL